MMKWISVMALTMLFCACTDAAPENAQKEPPVDFYQDDTAFRGEKKNYARYAELRGERELSPDFIAITSDYGDHEYTTLISYQDSLIQVAIDSNQVYENPMIAKEFVMGKVVLRQDAFKMLIKYFNNNCPALSDSVNPYPLYVIMIGSRQHRCYISSKDREAKNRYFKDLIKLIESSDHKNDYQPLLKAFQYIISI